MLITFLNFVCPKKIYTKFGIKRKKTNLQYNLQIDQLDHLIEHM